MRMAHLIYKATPDMKWRDSLKRAWTLIWLRGCLHRGTACFSYLKSDGSVRKARGTLSWHLIPETDKPEPGISVLNNLQYKVFTYYDIDRKAWRSFKIEAFISVTAIHELVSKPNFPLTKKDLQQPRRSSSEDPFFPDLNDKTRGDAICAYYERPTTND